MKRVSKLATKVQSMFAKKKPRRKSKQEKRRKLTEVEVVNLLNKGTEMKRRRAKSEPEMQKNRKETKHNVMICHKSSSRHKLRYWEISVVGCDSCVHHRKICERREIIAGRLNRYQSWSCVWCTVNICWINKYLKRYRMEYRNIFYFRELKRSGI